MSETAHTPSTTAEVDTHDLTIEDACFLLSSSRRRDVVSIIQADTVATTELYREITQLERDRGDGQDSRRKTRHSVRTSLAQTHLPTLADHDVIVQDRDRVRPGPNLTELVEILDRCEEVVG